MTNVQYVCSRLNIIVILIESFKLYYVLFAHIIYSEWLYYEFLWLIFLSLNPPPPIPSKNYNNKNPLKRIFLTVHQKQTSKQYLYKRRQNIDYFMSTYYANPIIFLMEHTSVTRISPSEILPPREKSVMTKKKSVKKVQ